MIEMASISEEQLRKALETPGGFAWWYLDLTSRSASGDIEGLVLIWSFGLPFLAGSRLAPRPMSRPSINLAVYRGGRADLYLLQQYESVDGVRGVDGSWNVGGSRFEVIEKDGAFAVQVELDEPVPGSRERLRGSVSARGARFPLTRSGGAPHVWSPRILDGTGSAELSLGSRRWSLTGSAYLDGNTSQLPLHAQRISSWRWGRFTVAGRTWVFYDVAAEPGGVGTALVLTAESGTSGEIRKDTSLVFAREKRGTYGMTAPREIRLAAGDAAEVICTARHLVDDGPFYQRFLLDVESAGETGHGVYEVVTPARVDLPRQRPFVSMRIHQPGADNSFWLPLFSGPRSGRIRRLFAAPWRQSRGSPS